jgi:hypothetical protein
MYEDGYGLAREDRDKRWEKYRGNYLFWGAPCLLIVCLPREATQGSYLDAGRLLVFD